MIKPSIYQRKPALETLSPWNSKQKDHEEIHISTYCNKTLPKLNLNHPKCQQNILNFNVAKRVKRRALSNVSGNWGKEKQKQRLREKEKSRQNSGNIFTRLAHSKQANKIIRSSREESRKILQPLQQLAMKNYIVEGSLETNMREMRKKQSSYIMKQKIVEIRRSLNMNGGLPIPNKMNRESKQEKENALLKLTRYEMN